MAVIENSWYCRFILLTPWSMDSFLGRAASVGSTCARVPAWNSFSLSDHLFIRPIQSWIWKLDSTASYIDQRIARNGNDRNQDSWNALRESTRRMVYINEKSFWIHPILGWHFSRLCHTNRKVVKFYMLKNKRYYCPSHLLGKHLPAATNHQPT